MSAALCWWAKKIIIITTQGWYWQCYHIRQSQWTLAGDFAICDSIVNIILLLLLEKRNPVHRRHAHLDLMPIHMCTHRMCGSRLSTGHSEGLSSWWPGHPRAADTNNMAVEIQTGVKQDDVLEARVLVGVKSQLANTPHQLQQLIAQRRESNSLKHSHRHIMPSYLENTHNIHKLNYTIIIKKL